jgi:hypothetical protein
MINDAPLIRWISKKMGKGLVLPDLVKRKKLSIYNEMEVMGGSTTPV